MKGYGQFCPVALASEIFAERWTPLILRELLAGARRFAELHRGVPRMSRNLLSQRLSALEHAGIIERRTGAHRKACEYHLTIAGHEFRSVIDALGTWGYKWCTHDLRDENIDADHLMWILRRLILIANLPERRVVVCFRFRQEAKRRFWLVLNRPEVDLCLFDPGFDVDLEVVTDVNPLAQICLGHLSVRDAMSRGGLSLCGPRQYCRAFGSWLGVSRFALPAVRSTGAG